MADNTLENPNGFYKKPEFATLQVHAGQSPDAEVQARAPPIYATASYVFKNTEHAGDVFGLRVPGNIYSRIMNPTVAVFEQRMAALEGGIEAVATSSGHAAQFMAISNIAESGDNIVATSFLYGGTYNQFKVFLKKFNITVKFVESDDPQVFAQAIDEKTKAIYIESIGNPKYNVPRIPEIATVAHEAGIPLIVDNTFGMGGYLVRPLEHGADIVTHSATKWINGHGNTIAGVVVDGGKFNWSSGKFPGFTEPAEGYHGSKFHEKYGAHAFAVKLRVDLMRDLGATLSPFAAFLCLMGLETLSLRAERHSTNAMLFAEWLESQIKKDKDGGNTGAVNWVHYPGLKSHSCYEVAQRLMRPGYYGGMVNFGVNGGEKEGRALVDRLKLASLLANVGDAKTLVIHPWTTTHEQLTPEEKLSCGVTPDLVRVSVGIEDISDIIADFAHALQAAVPQ